MSKKFYIYLITNNLTHKQYVGSRSNYNGDSALDNYMGSSKYLKDEITLYGKENFKKEILEEDIYINKIELLKKETLYILKYNTLFPNGYNRQKPDQYPGFYIKGSHHSPDSKRKISIGLKKAYAGGKKIVPDYSQEKHPMFGKHHSSESKEKISKAQIGKIISEEIKNKMHLAKIGIKKSEDHKKHISEGRTGIIFTNEHKKHISESHKGIINNISDEGRKILSETANSVNKRRILCPICNKEFNPGNYGRHKKCKHPS